MTDGVDAAVNSMQATSANPPQHRIVAETGSAELANCHNAMLPSGDLGSLQVCIVDFLGYMPNKSTMAGVLPGDRRKTVA